MFKDIFFNPEMNSDFTVLRKSCKCQNIGSIQQLGQVKSEFSGPLKCSVKKGHSEVPHKFNKDGSSPNTMQKLFLVPLECIIQIENEAKSQETSQKGNKGYFCLKTKRSKLLKKRKNQSSFLLMKMQLSSDIFERTLGQFFAKATPDFAAWPSTL